MKLKNEKEALQMFCDDDHCRPHLRRPFINDKDNGRIMATNGRIAIHVDPSLVECKYEHDEQRLPGFDYEANDINKVIDFADIEKAYNSFELVPEVVSKDGEPIECPECEGSGHVDYEYEDQKGNMHYCEEYCPVCNGTGKRDDYEEVETGRMLLPKNSTFGLDGIIFSAKLLWRVVSALRLMGFQRMTWNSKQEGVNFFSPQSGITVVVCAYLKKEENHRDIVINQNIKP